MTASQEAQRLISQGGCLASMATSELEDAFPGSSDDLGRYWDQVFGHTGPPPPEPSPRAQGDGSR